MTMVASVRNLFLGVTLMIVATAGCGDRSGTEPPRQRTVLRKKITMPQEPTPQAAKPGEETAVKFRRAEPRDKSVKQAQAPVKKAEGQATEGKTVRKPPQQLAKVEPTLVEKKPPVVEKKPPPSPDDSATQVLVKAMGKKKAYSYDATGKRDPFKPLFQIEAERITAAKQKTVEKKKKKRPPPTPLQRVALGQLKLVGVILSPTGNKALVEEPSGKGYIIYKGTYIGQNFGRVKEILQDRVIVEEEVEDLLAGKMKLQETELRLQKQLGDM